MPGLRGRGDRGGGVGPGVLTIEPFGRRGNELFCEGVSTAELAERFGTPLYVYSRTAIRQRFQELDWALAAVPHLIAYSVKANGNLAVLRALAELGAGADIVSGGELHRALLAGIPGERIVFSGVGKMLPEMVGALDAGVLGFNVESPGELRSLAALAAKRGVRAPVALRVNPDVESPTPHAYTRTGHAATKFGIPVNQALGLYREAANLPGIHVRGVDVHIGSQILEPAPYLAALLQVLELVEQLADEGIGLDYLDLGGGLGISYAGGEGITAAAFASTILPHVAPTGLQLIVEPGRFIVGGAGILISRVLYVKEGGGKTFVITDAGMNDLLRPSHYEGFHRIELLRQGVRRRARADVVGPICETGDFLALDRELELPDAGDLLAVFTAGAYGFSMSSTYNQRPRAAEVMVEGEQAVLVRRRETIEDLVAGEIGL